MTSKAFPSRYKYLNKKFSGGLGDVFLCKDRQLNRKVAIKFIQDKDFSSLMQEEIKALQSIRSKHVVEIYDLIISKNSDDIGLVQEYIPGDDLTTLIPDAKANYLESNAFLKLIYQISCGVKDIHAVPIIHRDIKLNNIKLSAENVVKLFDFGFAKSKDLSAETKGFKGTYGFAAPELYAPPVKIQKSADVYAVGICAWFLAVGKLPPELKTMPPTTLKSSLVKERPDLPRRVATLLDKCISPDPADRPTMNKVVDLLTRYLVQGQHRGVLSSSANRFVLNNKDKAVVVRMGTLGEVVISYTGVDFEVELKTGDVFLNNKQVKDTEKLPGASVLVFGNESLHPAMRKALTFDVSHPEVVL